ncbi:unnamed protein product, partial [Prorocentrum cordatum]
EALPVSAACGAPAAPAQAFVPAPVAAAGPAQSLGNDMDDLLAELTTNDPAAVPHSMVQGFHCTGCDFQVMRCEDFVWAEDVEYMFLRNNYPTFDKLRRRLVRKQGCLAYCCQCSWKSAHRGAPLADVADGLRWRVLSF